MKSLENKDSLDGVSTLSLWFNLVWSDMTYYCKSSQLSLSPFQGNTTDILHFFVVLLNQCINIIEETILLQYYYLKSRGPLEPDFYIAVEDLRHFFCIFAFLCCCVLNFCTFVFLYFTYQIHNPKYEMHPSKYVPNIFSFLLDIHIHDWNLFWNFPKGYNSCILDKRISS